MSNFASRGSPAQEIRLPGTKTNFLSTTLYKFSSYCPLETSKAPVKDKSPFGFISNMKSPSPETLKLSPVSSSIITVTAACLSIFKSAFTSKPVIVAVSSSCCVKIASGFSLFTKETIPSLSSIFV